MPKSFVPSSHNQSIFCPCSHFKCITRKTIIFNYKAVISPSSKRAATMRIELSYDQFCK